MKSSGITSPERPAIVLIYKTLGPYHWPRLQNLARKLKPYADVLCIVIASEQTDYIWKTEQPDDLAGPNPLKVVTLFRDKSLEDIGIGLQTLAVVRAIRSVQIRLLLTAGYAYLPMVVASLAARRSGTSSVVMFDSNRFDHPRQCIREALKRLVLKVFDGGLVAGTHSRDYLSELGIDSQHMELACDVVDNDEVVYQVAAARQKQPEEPCLLFVGRFVEKKNLPLLLSAYERYRSICPTGTALPLVLCGAGPLEGHVRQHVAASNLAGVEFAGYIGHPEIYRYYARARALILPSIHDQWGLVVNEALAGGVPALVSDACGCVPELIKDGLTGWAFPSEDANALAETMWRIHALDPDQQEKMSRECVATVQEFGLQRFTDGIERLVGRLAGIGPYASNVSQTDFPDGAEPR